MCQGKSVYNINMSEVDPQVYPIDFESMITNVWLYVNPLKGCHAITSNKGRKLAVFINENVGRKWELKSDTLKRMIGYLVTWEEMKIIASKECDNRYELFLDTN